MTNFILAVLVILGIAGVYLVSRESQTFDAEIQASNESLNTSFTLAKKMTPTPGAEPVSNSTPAAVAIGRSAANDPTQLEQEEQRLVELRQNLETVRNQQARQSQQAGLAYPERIYENTAQIQSLMGLLQENTQIENDINLAAAHALSQQSSAWGMARDQIDQAIQLLNQGIQRTQEQIVLWQRQPFDRTRQAAELEFLQSQLSSQEQQMLDLRSQRVDISAQVLDQGRAIYREATQARETLKANQDEIQDQIAILRQEVIDLQNARNRIRISLLPLSEQVRQAQEKVTEQEARVHSLQDRTTISR